MKWLKIGTIISILILFTFGTGWRTGCPTGGDCGPDSDYVWINRDSINLYIGFDSIDIYTGGNYNVFVGDSIGSSMIAGCRENVVIGARLGQNLANAYRNVIMGYRAAQGITNSHHNVIIGQLAAHGIDYNDIYNVIVGSNAWQVNADGSRNTIVGYMAGGNKGDAGLNTIIGERAGYSSGTAAQVIFIGSQAGYSETTTGAFVLATNDTSSLLNGQTIPGSRRLNVNGMFRFPLGYPGDADTVYLTNDGATDIIGSPGTGDTYVDTTGGDTLKCYLNSAWEVK